MKRMGATAGLACESHVEHLGQQHVVPSVERVLLRTHTLSFGSAPVTETIS